MKTWGCLILATGIVLAASQAEGYKLLTDPTNGGNPKLDKKTYKVYIQADPTGNSRDKEVKEALDKWKTELGGKGVALEVQTGSPPQTPFDLDKYNEEVKKYNDAQNPDINDFPEIQKFEAKKCTVMVYFESTADLVKRGGGAERGLTKNVWGFDAQGHADKIDFSDVFVASDPPGATEDIKKRITFNIALHEFGHTAGLDHYTPEQDKTGEVMETDATLHSTKLDLGDEEKKGTETLYGKSTSKADNQGAANFVETSSLAAFIQDEIPDDQDHVWEYRYGLNWLEGAPISYVQLPTNKAPIFTGFGADGLEDWILDLPSGNENYLEFYADKNYLGEGVTNGSLYFYTSTKPGSGFLVFSGGQLTGPVPAPEPATLFLFGAGLAGAFIRKRKDR